MKGITEVVGVRLAAFREACFELLNPPERFGALETPIGQVFEDLIEGTGRLTEIVVCSSVLEHGLQGALEGLEGVLVDEERFESPGHGDSGPHGHLELRDNHHAEHEEGCDPKLRGQVEAKRFARVEGFGVMGGVLDRSAHERGRLGFRGELGSVREPRS